MRYQDKDATIGEVVIEIPKATDIFKEFGIDYCCGGHRRLAEVVQEQKIDAKKLYERLEQAYEIRKKEYEKMSNRYEEMSPVVLATYIDDTHHGYLRHALPEAIDLLSTILRVHGKNHKELFEVYRLFGQLKSDLEQHLLKEETMLFPDLEDIDSNLSDIIELTQTIISEHEAAGELLKELRRVTTDYKLPEDACGTFARTYSLLEEIEEDLHQHIHLENNILLKDYSSR
jgi:regulator of cell morphogenesis and NO signaling